MPPEKTYDWDEPKRMPYYMRGARSYFDFGNRNSAEDISGSPGKEVTPTSRFHIRSFLTRLGLLG